MNYSKIVLYELLIMVRYNDTMHFSGSRITFAVFSVDINR